MIFDRTIEDVLAALKIREKKIKNFLELTSDEKIILDKGFLTISTINRIEEKQAELSLELQKIGYFNATIETKVWSNENVFGMTDFRRIIDNAEHLRKAFFVHSTTPLAPEPKYHFKVLNDLEKILYDIEEMINFVKQNYEECGNFECGE